MQVTHKCSIPATSNKMESGIINIGRIKDGFIVEEWEVFDGLSFMGALSFELQTKAE